MRRLTLAASLAAALALPASAHGAFFPAEVIDGPGEIVSAGDVDLARDGSGAVAYVKREGGIDRVFVSRFVDGAFTTPERVDGGLAGPSSQPVVGAASGGRLAVAFVNGGSLVTTVRPDAASSFTAPALVAHGAVSNPSLDMGVNEQAYVSFTQGGDVRVARIGRNETAFTVVPGALDIAPAAEAGTGNLLRSRVAVPADGSAVVVWGEQGADGRSHVHARRVFELRLSAAPQDLTLDAVDGAAATDADTPELDVEDDPSYAQVIFRQRTAAGPRTVMRRLVGSQFEAPTTLASGAAATAGRIDLSGRGDAVFGVDGAGGEVFGGTLFDNAIGASARLDAGNALTPNAAPGVGDNEIGSVAWLQGTSAADATVRARHFPAVEAPVAIEPEVVLTRPELGPAVPGAGLDASASRTGDVVAVFVQAGPDGHRLATGVFDRPPSRAVPHNTSNPKPLKMFKWGRSVNVLGPVTYQVVVDGRLLGQTRRDRLRVRPGMVSRGTHRWRIISIDRRGQRAVSRTGIVRVVKPRRAKKTRRTG